MPKQNVQEGLGSGFAKPGYNASISSSFLGERDGVFSIWGFVTDVHNQVHATRRHMYLVGYATNGGNQLNNPKLAAYSNAWAIQRLTPIPSDHDGVWRFWSNATAKESTSLDFTGVVSGGWHLFSVSWSRNEDYIKFIIDNEIVSESNFENWPTDFSSSCCLGTWPNKGKSHYFESIVGPWRFNKTKYSPKLISEFLIQTPSLK